MSTFTKRIDANIRDVGWDGFSELESSASSLGNPGAVTRSVSLRFTSVTIGQGDTINSAKITFTGSDSRSSQTINMKIHGVDEDNTAEFVISPADTARTRTKTTANVDWDATITTSDGSTHDTADITSVVQEIVDRGGWSSGNAMAFWVTDDGSSSGNYINVYDYNTDSTKAALLTIDYTSATTTSTTTTSTSTTTSTTTTLPWVYGEDSGVGIKISRETKDATDNNPNHFLLHSSYPQLQVYKTGQFSSNFTDGSTKVIDHNLGYKPFALGYMQWYDGVNDVTETDYRICDWSIEGAAYLHYTRMEIGKNDITFYVTDTNLDKFVTLKGYYIIFRNPIDEVYNV